jgi:hypothetical protein
MLIMFEQFFHQAHGPTGVVSDRAVNDLDVQHSPSADFEKLYPPRSQIVLKGAIYDQAFHIIEAIRAKTPRQSHPQDWI